MENLLNEIVQSAKMQNSNGKWITTRDQLLLVLYMRSTPSDYENEAKAECAKNNISLGR